MSLSVKKLLLGWASVLMVLASIYCSLGIFQAASLFTGERALFNLRFWGVLMGFSLIAAVILGFLAARTGKAGASK